MKKPSRNQTISQTTMPSAAETDSVSTPAASAAATPRPPIRTIWMSPTTPIPSTLPAISCHGRMVASSSSTTRLVFSSTTPCATIWPLIISEM